MIKATDPAAGEGWELPMIPGYKSMMYVMHEKAGPGLWQTLANAVEKVRQIKVLYATAGKELVQNPVTKEILGVVADEAGKKIHVKAKKGVILTCGGFEWNEEMKMEFFGYPTAFYANPGNTGEGIKMAQGVGAALWHINSCGGRGIPKTGLVPNPSGGYPHFGAFIHVDKLGRRFYDESLSNYGGSKKRPHTVWLEVLGFNTTLHTFPKIPSYCIFDEATRLKGPICGNAIRGLLPDGKIQFFYQWSSDNSVEIEKGWIIKGETIEELAEKIKKTAENGGYMDAATLKNTLTKWNKYCAAGKDSEFGADLDYLKPINKPPYYAQMLLPAGMATYGGPKRNAKSQVVDTADRPIPRLYAAGESDQFTSSNHPSAAQSGKPLHSVEYQEGTQRLRSPGNKLLENKY